MSDNGSDWHPFLPSMLANRYSPTVANTGTPEYLLVIGGEDKAPNYTMEVLVEQQWSRVGCIPVNFAYIKHTIHNGSLYLYGEGAERRIAYCDLHELIMCVESESSCDGDALSWKVLENERFHFVVSLVSLQNRWLCLTRQYSSRVLSLCVGHNESLITVGTSADTEVPRFSTWGRGLLQVLPNRNLVCVVPYFGAQLSGFSVDTGIALYTASIQGSYVSFDVHWFLVL